MLKSPQCKFYKGLPKDAVAYALKQFDCSVVLLDRGMQTNDSIRKLVAEAFAQNNIDNESFTRRLTINKVKFESFFYDTTSTNEEITAWFTNKYLGDPAQRVTLFTSDDSLGDSLGAVFIPTSYLQPPS